MDETTKKRLHDHLDLLIESTRQKRKLDGNEALELKHAIKDLILQKFGPDPESLGKDVWKMILPYALNFDHPCNYDSIPVVCKLWKELYENMENDRLEAFLALNHTSPIWNHILLYALEIGVITSISANYSGDDFYVFMRNTSLVVEVGCGRTDCHYSIDNSPKSESAWCIKYAYGSSEEIFEKIGNGDYVLTFGYEKDFENHKNFYEFMVNNAPYNELDWKTRWDSKYKKDPQFKQILLEINKKHKLF